ncbi:MAG: L-aspartate oxidase, partial [Thermus sp.]
LQHAKLLPLSEGLPERGLTRREVEAGNLAFLTHLLLTGALLREESRGVHFREDFPHPSPRPYHTEWRGEKLERVYLERGGEPTASL